MRNLILSALLLSASFLHADAVSVTYSDRSAHQPSVRREEAFDRHAVPDRRIEERYDRREDSMDSVMFAIREVEQKERALALDRMRLEREERELAERRARLAHEEHELAVSRTYLMDLKIRAERRAHKPEPTKTKVKLFFNF